MTVAILALTDTDEVRATIGADDKDLSDTYIMSASPEDDLKADLLTWVPTYQTIITEGTGGSPTTEQELKYLRLKVYAKNFISWLVASAAQHSLAQKVSDGSNEMSRFTNNKLAELLARLEDRMKASKAELEKLIDSTSTSTYSQFGTASPSYDPVTNE